MTDPAVSSIDVRASRTKTIIFVAILAVVLVGGAIVAWKLLTNEPGGAACDNLAELRKTDPRADQVVDRLVRHVEGRVVEQQLVDGVSRVKVSGDTPDERCRDAIDKLDKAMGHGPFTRMVDCIATAKTARSAALCF